MTTDIKHWLTPAARDLERLRAHGRRVDLRSCEACGSNNWNTEGRVALMFVAAETDITHRGPILLMTTCLNCAAVRLFNNGQLLALEEQASAKESKP